MFTAEMRKQREFYHKLGMEVPGDAKGEACSAKQHSDPHRNGESVPWAFLIADSTLLAKGFGVF